jgi:hypothetical protein
MIKVFIVILVLLTLTTTSNICNTCIILTELVQEGLIFMAPNFVAKDLVKSVCEKQCNHQKYSD